MSNKRILFLAAILLFSWIVGCNSLNDEKQPDLMNQLGTIEQFGIHADQFVIRPDADTTIAYRPVLNELPEEFKKVGLRVIFSGNIQPFPIDPAHDRRYPLLEVTEIATLNTRAESTWQVFTNFWR